MSIEEFAVFKQHQISSQCSAETELAMYGDVDWEGDCRARKFNSGHLVCFGGGIMSWGSRKQACGSLSSTEAECVAIAKRCQERIWIRKLIEEIGVFEYTIVVYEDNQSCMKMVESECIE